MSFLTSDARFFGLDLRALWREVRQPWQQLSRSPLLAWLSPAEPVTLVHTEQGQSVWMGDRLVAAPRRIQNSAVAIELPEDLVLRRVLRVPVMGDADMASAAELEAHAHSPFAVQDLVWGYCRVQSPGEGMREIEIAMASRRLVAQHLAALAAHAASLGPHQPEVWVRSSTQRKPIVLGGYGEARRYVRQKRGRIVGYVLLGLILVLLCGMAITPTAQLRLRAIEAVHAYDDIVHRTTSIVERRDALMQSVEKLDALSHMLSGRIEPLKVLDRLTQVLPDDTAVQSFKLQGVKVTIAGDTGNASVLLQKLGEQPGLSDVKAPTAAVRMQGAVKETYAIEFTVDPQAFGMPMAVPVVVTALPVGPEAAPMSATASAPAPAATPSSSAPATSQQVKPDAPVATFGGRATFGGTKSAPASSPVGGRN